MRRSERQQWRTSVEERLDEMEQRIEQLTTHIESEKNDHE